MGDYERFTLTPDHLTLLRHAYVGWEECEFGAPAIDCKRPYGNSDVYGDIAELLGILPANGEDGFSEQQQTAMRTLHQETQTVLQILICVGDLALGTYEAPTYSTAWRRIAATDER